MVNTAAIGVEIIRKSGEIEHIDPVEFIELDNGHHVYRIPLSEISEITVYRVPTNTAVQENKCTCIDVDFGSYENQIMLGWYPIMDGYRLARKEKGLGDSGVCVDRCVAADIVDLWVGGVRTYGSCCGHGKLPGMINVDPADFDKALSLGWGMYEFPDEPGRRDTLRWPQ